MDPLKVEVVGVGDGCANLDLIMIICEKRNLQTVSFGNIWFFTIAFMECSTLSCCASGSIGRWLWISLDLAFQ